MDALVDIAPRPMRIREAAHRGRAQGCVIQITVPRFVQPSKLVVRN
eukprot:COSAG01_NODE_69047_length_262_cov_0.957055_1_plen_45_part_10